MSLFHVPKEFKADKILNFKMLHSHRVFSKIPRLFVKAYMKISCYYVNMSVTVNQILQ